MNWKSYVVVSGAGVLATWAAAVPPSLIPGARSPEQPPAAVAVSAAVAAAAADVEEQAARLHVRLRMDAGYRQPARNLFVFAAAPRVAPPATPAPVVGVAPVAEPAAPAPLPLRLTGVAIDPAGRTAILSTPGGVVLALVGDEPTPGYRVTAIADNAVELTRSADGGVVTLSF